MPAMITPRMRILHAPKTGGTWVWRAIEAAGVQFELFGWPEPGGAGYHADLAATEDYADRFTIAFVRHPLDWWRSLWAYRMRTGWDRTRTVDSLAGSDDFDTFIARVLEHLPGHLEEQFARYIGPPSQPVAFIGRFEALADDLVGALQAAGEEFDEQALRSYPPDNANDYVRFPAAYRRDLAVRLADSERAVIERFYAEEPTPRRLLAPSTPAARVRSWWELRSWRATSP